MAQLVPFRARATFEAAPARNDVRPRTHVARLRVLRDYSAVTGLSQLGDYFRVSDHPAEAAKTRACATIKD